MRRSLLQGVASPSNPRTRAACSAQCITCSEGTPAAAELLCATYWRRLSSLSHSLASFSSIEGQYTTRTYVSTNSSSYESNGISVKVPELLLYVLRVSISNKLNWNST